MFGKAILLLVLATIAVQSVPYEVEEQLTLLDVNAGSLIDQLRELIEKAVKVAKAALEKLEKELVEKIKEIIEIAKTKFGKQLKELLEKLEKLKEEAAKLRVDIRQCLSGHEAELKNLANEFNKKVVACNQDIINKGKAILDEEKKAVDDSIETVEKLAEEFKACGSGVDSVKCKVDVSIKIGKAIVEVPAKINKIVIDAAPAILELIPAAGECVHKETTDLVARGEKLVQDIETCIEKKIHPQ